ncbi:hypothetical protein [Mycobacterium terramassiliense]|uniref:hypothetical protein n=1 Tax=Mycobacterium terramassiliense TaxID=1841859 RepID=UPI0012FF93EE|nr:hypothetical protein [Mycobacterium terramassiliense]
MDDIARLADGLRRRAQLYGGVLCLRRSRFDEPTGGDEMFRQLVSAGIIEPAGDQSGLRNAGCVFAVKPRDRWSPNPVDTKGFRNIVWIAPDSASQPGALRCD